MANKGSGCCFAALVEHPELEIYKTKLSNFLRGDGNVNRKKLDKGTGCF